MKKRSNPIPPMTESDIARFWEKVDKKGPDDCWLWTGSTASGYGQLKINRRMVGTHRVSWELHNGPIPDGVYVLHDCPNGDNPLCVNPSHLWLGSHQQNMDDMKNKGRCNGQKGEANGMAKLSDAQIPKIFADRDTGMTQGQIGKKYGVSNQQISHILNGKQRTLN